MVVQRLTQASQRARDACLDIDECAGLSAAGELPCGPDTLCVNVPGSYRCSDRSHVGCMNVDPATGQCRSARAGFCQTGMTFDSAAGRCVGKKCTSV